jgi:hypothetical protein
MGQMMTVDHKAWCRQRRRELLSRIERSEYDDLEIRTLSFFVERNFSDQEFRAKLAERIHDDRLKVARSVRVCRRILQAWTAASGDVEGGLEPVKWASWRSSSLTLDLSPRPGTAGDPDLGGWRPLGGG